MPSNDPVCGMKVESNSPHRTEYKGQTYYFCSSDCKEEFMANPEQYAKKKTVGSHSKNN